MRLAGRLPSWAGVKRLLRSLNPLGTVWLLLRWTALAAVALLVIDAVLSHPFWAMRAGARDVQLLHFMKNIAIAGGFLLLSAIAPRR